MLNIVSTDYEGFRSVDTAHGKGPQMTSSNVREFSRLRRVGARIRQRGLTLIEAAMVLVIFTLVIAGVMIYYQSASSNQRTNEAMGQLAQVQQAVRAMYAGSPNYAGISTTVIAQGKNLPGKMVSGTTIRHAFNNTVAINPANISGGTANGFSVLFSGVPADACIKLLTVDLGTGLADIQVGSGTATASFTPATATAACATDTNNITWRFF